MTNNVLDITNLSGADLFKALSTGKKFVINKTSEAVKKGEVLPVVKHTPFIDKWTEVAAVFIRHEITCVNCGSCFSFPNANVFVKETHKTLGIHHRAVGKVEFNIAKQNLPLETELHSATSLFCQDCVRTPLNDR